MNAKVCCGCKKNKTLDEYTPSKKGKLGRISRCRECMRLVNKANRDKAKPIRKHKRSINFSKVGNGENVIYLNDGKYTIIDKEDYDRVSKYVWYYLNSGYAINNNCKTKKHKLLHRFIMNAPKDKNVDHINGNKLDNRKKNLRLCCQHINGLNRTSLNKNNTSGYRNVSFDNKSKKWRAFIKINGNQIHLGYFENPQDGSNAVEKFLSNTK